MIILEYANVVAKVMRRTARALRVVVREVVFAFRHDVRIVNDLTLAVGVAPPEPHRSPVVAFDSVGLRRGYGDSGWRLRSFIHRRTTMDSGTAKRKRAREPTAYEICRDAAWRIFVQQDFLQPRDEHGRVAPTLLYRAAETGDDALVSWLLGVLGTATINNSAKHQHGLTPLLIASRKGHSRTVRALLKCGADPNQAERPHDDDDDDEDLWTPLLYAVVKGHFGVAKTLLSHQANPNLGNRERTPLIEALEGDHRGVKQWITMLLAKGADVNQCDCDNGTPLYYAVRYCDTDVVKLLLDNGAAPSVDVAPLNLNRKSTPLHCAVEYRDIAKIKLLLAHEACTEQKNSKGETVWDVLKRITRDAKTKKARRGLTTIARLLINKMAGTGSATQLY